MSITPVRGHVYRIQDDKYGKLHCLVISTVPAFEADSSCLAVRVSVTHKRHDFPGWIRLASGDPGFGYVITHDLDRVALEELQEDLGPLSLTTMYAVEHALKRMLGM